MKEKITVIKIGGSELEKDGFLDSLVNELAQNRHQKTILVHGGGSLINELLAKFGQEPEYINGQRVTDEKTLQIAEMVLSGQMNKQIVRALLAAEMDAIGLSGVDRGMIRVKPSDVMLGRVGVITSVNGEVMKDFLKDGILPVISPISLGPDGAYNVNADLAASAIASSVNADSLIFLTSAPGVVIHETKINSLNSIHVEAFINEGLIHSGMIPKVTAGLQAVEAGVPHVMITDIMGWREGTGTMIISQSIEERIS